MGESEISYFLIFCQDKEDVTRIKVDIGMQPDCLVDTSENTQWTSQRISSGQVQCLIFNCSLFNMGSLKTISGLRGNKVQLPVIVIADRIDKEILGYNRKLQYILLIERKHYNYGAMFDLCTRVRQGKSLYRRTHERFMTKQPVDVERLTDHKLFTGIMTNTSRGGAFLDVKGSLSDGDILKITIELPEVKKAHVVFGEVVRLIKEGYATGECGVGIRYISPQDLYNALLEKSS